MIRALRIMPRHRAEKLLGCMRRHMRRRMPDVAIGGDYLHRWHLIPKNRWLNVYLHEIGRDDDDRALHDHPWWNVSLILLGGYREVTRRGTYLRTEGQMVLRSPGDPHRLEVKYGPVISLFVTGPREQEWGFHCPQGWRHHEKFIERGGCE